MADKYQVLSKGSNEHSIIEKKVVGGNREIWEVYIPDAGGRNQAARVARLLNAEHQLLLDTKAGRDEDIDD